MSRSNPQEQAQNPARRWFEWNGETGTVRYYDKEKKKNIDVGSDFSFVLLDQLGSVGGWNEASKSAIYSNMVKDTRADVMVVKAFKGGTMAEGLYKDIKTTVNTKAVGGYFVANCYLAFKDETGTLQIGVLKLKGSALGAWMEFAKNNRDAMYSKGIRIKGFTEGKKGKIVFRTPVLTIAELSEATNTVAVGLDKQLQEFLAVYLKRNTREQAERAADDVSDDEGSQDHDYDDDYRDDVGFTSGVSEDDIPF